MKRFVKNFVAVVVMLAFSYGGFISIWHVESRAKNFSVISDNEKASV